MGAESVLLTGASGLLGTWLRRTAPPGVAVTGLARRNHVDVEFVLADLRDRASVTDVIERVQPSLVIHAAYANDHASIVEATGNVVEASADVGADVLYVSTDAVFAGDGRPRSEHEVPDPTWDYGRWKAEAERLVTDRGSRSAIVRLPLIVSVDPDDRVVAAIRAGAEADEPTAWFDDELRQPAGARELAGAIWRIAQLEPDERAGAWHLPGPETLSRYEIAERVVRALGLSPETVCGDRNAGSLDRPRYLALADERARAGVGWSPSPILTTTD